jgi:hypothetical protein
MAGCLFERLPSDLVKRSLKPIPGLHLTHRIWRARHVIVSQGETRLEFECQSQRGSDGDLCLRHFEVELSAVPHRAVKGTEAIDEPPQLLVLVVAFALLACIPITS